MSQAVLSLGSNLGDRMSHLRAAVLHLGSDVRAVSSVYETAPWGPVDQDDFLNVVVLAQREGRTPRQWWALAQRMEQEAGRTRSVRWGPRTLDVDIVAVVDDAGESVVLEDEDLTLPHPRAEQRGFVLIPWAEVDPSASLAGMAVTDLIAALPEAERAGVRRTALSVTS